MADDIQVTEQPVETNNQPVQAPIPAAEPAHSAEPAAAPEKPKSVRETLLAAKSEVEARSRDEQGRFAPKAPEAPPVTAKPVEAKQPPGWTKNLKHVVWDKLPQPVRDALERETAIAEAAEFHEKAKPDAEFAAAVKQRLKPFEQFYRNQGMDERQAVEFLISMQDKAMRDPTGYIVDFAKTARIDLAALAAAVYGQGRQPQSQGQPQPDPRYQQLEQRYSTLERTLQDMQNAPYLQQIQAFRSAKNADGTPKYPHFEKVGVHMVHLLRTSPEPISLEQAYENAVYVDPQLRAEVLTAKQAEEAKKREEDAKRMSEEAKRAGSPSRGAPGGTRVAAKGATLRDTIKMAMEEARA